MKIRQIGFYTVNYFSLIVLLANVVYPLYVIVYNSIVFGQNVILIRIAGIHALNLLFFGIFGIILLLLKFKPHEALITILFYAAAHETIWNIFYLTYRTLTGHFAMYILYNLAISFLLAIYFFSLCKMTNIFPSFSWLIFNYLIFGYLGYLTIWALFGFPVSNSDLTLSNPTLMTNWKINLIEVLDVLLFLLSINPKKLEFPRKIPEQIGKNLVENPE